MTKRPILVMLFGALLICAFLAGKEQQARHDKDCLMWGPKVPDGAAP